MKYLLRDLYRDIISEAKRMGIWQGLTVDEQAEVVGCILREYGSFLREAEIIASPGSGEGAAA